MKSFTKAKIFGCPLRAIRRLLGKLLKLCTIDVKCCAIVVVQRYGGAMFVVQPYCGVVGVVYGGYLVKSEVYLTIPYF